MNLKDRFRIAPQMEAYDQLSTTWKPYTMYFHQPDFQSPNVSTDENGFRNTINDKFDTIFTYEEFLKTKKQNAALILGGSTVFGVGATHDRYTLASCLNRLSDTKWFNFGGRAFNSTQELILFLLYSPTHISKLVIFSGINNFILPLMTGKSSMTHNSFFFQTRFEKSMMLEPDEMMGIKYRAKQLSKEILNKINPQKNFQEESQKPDLLYEQVCERFQRDLAVLCALAQSYQFTIHFIFQPFAAWIDKELTSEEKTIFAILDQQPHIHWRVIAQIGNQYKDQYIQKVKAICHRHRVHFFDMNAREEFQKGKWLFVDRGHLTDQGYELAAHIIKQEVGLEAMVP